MCCCVLGECATTIHQCSGYCPIIMGQVDELVAGPWAPSDDWIQTYVSAQGIGIITEPATIACMQEHAPSCFDEGRLTVVSSYQTISAVFGLPLGSSCMCCSKILGELKMKILMKNKNEKVTGGSFFYHIFSCKLHFLYQNQNLTKMRMIACFRIQF